MFVPENSGCPDGGPDTVLTARPGPASGGAPALTGAMLVQYCAPTLAGLKTASLFSCSFSDKQEMRTAVRRWNRTLRDKGLRMLPLRRPEGPTLIYVYRVSRLAQVWDRRKQCKCCGTGVIHAARRKAALRT